MRTGLNSLLTAAAVVTNYGVYPLIAAVCAAAFMFLVFVGVYVGVNRSRLDVERRVNALTDDQKEVFVKSKEKKRKKSSSLRLFENNKFLENLTDRLIMAGIPLKSDEFITLWMAATLISTVLAYIVTGNMIIALAFVIIGAGGPMFYVKTKIDKRMELFNNQLGDSLGIMSNCLRSGLSFQQAMESIAKEMPDPISKEFGRVLREVRFGSTVDDALNALCRRINNSDLELMVSAILIQRQVGGNLSEILDNISETILGRIKIRNEIRVLTATGRASGVIIGMLPIAVSLVLMLINPTYLEPMFSTPIGIGLLCLCVVMESTGFWLVTRIAKIEY